MNSISVGKNYMVNPKSMFQYKSPHHRQNRSPLAHFNHSPVRPNNSPAHKNNIASFANAVKYSSRTSIQNQRLQQPKHDCFLCGKNAAYTSFTLRKYFCSDCAIKQMLKGVQIVEISKIQENRMINNFVINHSPQRNIKNNRSFELENFLMKIQNQQIKLKNKQHHYHLLSEKLSHTYNDRKKIIKEHYQKLQAAIQQSFNNDIKVIQALQTQECQSLDSIKHTIQSQLESLIKMKNDIRPNFQNIIQIVEANKYYEFMNHYHHQLEQIAISIQTNEHQIPSLTILSPNEFIYFSQTYRILNCDKYAKCSQNNSSPSGNVFFSFSKKA